MKNKDLRLMAHNIAVDRHEGQQMEYRQLHELLELWIYKALKDVRLATIEECAKFLHELGNHHHMLQENQARDCCYFAEAELRALKGGRK